MQSLICRMAPTIQSQSQSTFDMNIDDGATHEINSRWPVHKQRNCGMMWDWYGVGFFKKMVSGIQLVRDHHAALKSAGETEWSMPPELTSLLDSLAAGDS